MNFDQLDLIDPIRKALKEEGYTQPTPIQSQSIPAILSGRDLFGAAQTGTGKTAAFSIPLLQLLAQRVPSGRREVRSLILAPTRELAIQIGESIAAYGRHLNLRHSVIFGGVSQHSQVEALRRGVDILVATPGRLQDLHNQRLVNLSHVEIFILDEADRMLDMGFIADVKRIIPLLPANRQTLLFSATLPKEIRELMMRILRNPVFVEVTPVTATADKVEQQLYYVNRETKRDLLHHVLSEADVSSALVFTRTKHGADKVAKDLSKRGIQAEAIHGNKSQNARQRALGDFRSGRLKVLVATDIASRGIDVEELSHVINFDLPDTPETYIHRIGRTGRAGASGKAWSFCAAEDLHLLNDIQKHTKSKLPLTMDHPFHAEMPAVAPPPMSAQDKSRMFRDRESGGAGAHGRPSGRRQPQRGPRKQVKF